VDKLYERFNENFKVKIGNYTIPEWGTILASMNSEAFSVENTGTLFKLYSLYAYLKFPYLHIIPTALSEL